MQTRIPCTRLSSSLLLYPWPLPLFSIEKVVDKMERRRRKEEEGGGRRRCGKGKEQEQAPEQTEGQVERASLESTLSFHIW